MNLSWTMLTKEAGKSINILNFGLRNYLWLATISNLWYAKIYRQFIWEWRDHQGSHWHALFVYVASCKKGWHFSPFDQVWFMEKKNQFFFVFSWQFI
jgi:hypothetical protein